ncbi:MAG: hypothetical protein K6G40_08660 [Eubacterium sp.]|nr:hypothetical protein [Eubacterium sp.]
MKLTKSFEDKINSLEAENERLKELENHLNKLSKSMFGETTNNAKKKIEKWNKICAKYSLKTEKEQNEFLQKILRKEAPKSSNYSNLPDTLPRKKVTP